MAGLYIHVPFCASKCIYCDFYSVVTERELKEPFIQAVKQELLQRKDYLQGESIQTIYFGGGTPSRLSPASYQEVFETIYKNYSVDQGAEITLEANPDDLSDDYLKGIQALPFNRLSLGVQSFDDTELKFMNRRHSAKEAVEAVDRSKEVGFENISIDLIFGIPGQTDTSWQLSLEQAIRLDVPHISAYGLTYEEGTKLWQLLKNGKINEIDEDTSLRFFDTLIDTLQGVGYEQYEISNYAKPGRYSRHNSAYWEGEKYLGAGPSAHSFDGASRQWNVASTTQYATGITSGKPVFEKELLSLKDQYNDMIITRLRTKSGINVDALHRIFGEEMAEAFFRQANEYLQAGYLKNIANQVFLTRKGLYVSDRIMIDLLLT